jgi:hypothetical protein
LEAQKNRVPFPQVRQIFIEGQMLRVQTHEGQGVARKPFLKSCVIPVAAADALAWATGKIDDTDLLLKSPLKTEAIFILELPGIGAWRDCIGRMIYFHQRGAVTAVCHTDNPLMARHMVRKGLVATFARGNGVRYIFPPEPFANYLKPFAKKHIAAIPDVSKSGL